MLIIKTDHFCISAFHQIRQFSDGITFFNMDITYNRYAIPIVDVPYCQDPVGRLIIELFNFKIIEIEYYP